MIKSKLPTPAKKKEIALDEKRTNAVCRERSQRTAPMGDSAVAVAAKRLKRRSIEVTQQAANRPPLAKKPCIRPVISSGYGRRNESSRVSHENPPFNANSSRSSNSGALPFFGRPPPVQTGRPTNVMNTIVTGRPRPNLTRSNSSASNIHGGRQSTERRFADFEARIEALEEEKRAKEVETGQVDAEMESIKKELAETRLHSANQSRELERVQNECTVLKEALNAVSSSEAILKAQNAALKSQNSVLENQSVETEALVKELKSQILALVKKCGDNELHFRTLHNDIVDLKGNIRVAVRVRPFLKDEPHFGQLPPHLQFPNANKIVIESAKGSSQSEFQRVFSPSDEQQTVFDELKDLIQSTLHGYNVTIFAYGQTGSGKTYTMQGDSVCPKEKTAGVIPRSVAMIFATIESLADLGWKYSLSASFLEIYNEEIYDLLSGGRDKLDVKVGGGVVKVPDLSCQDVSNASQVFAMLKSAELKRSVGSTKCNVRSSRSHAVFQLKIDGKNASNGESCTATLNLVDLAGSERLKESGAEGVRLIETQHINTALSNLQNVIRSIRSQSKKSGHVPYRNSKLTMLLQQALGAGNSKTLMIVNLSPLVESCEETRRSIDFALQTSKTHIGQAKKG